MPKPAWASFKDKCNIVIHLFFQSSSHKTISRGISGLRAMLSHIDLFRYRLLYESHQSKHCQQQALFNYLIEVLKFLFEYARTVYKVLIYCATRLLNGKTQKVNIQCGYRAEGNTDPLFTALEKNRTRTIATDKTISTKFKFQNVEPTRSLTRHYKTVEKQQVKILMNNVSK